MINIYKELIKKYIQKLNINDIKLYCINNNIQVTNEEISIIYCFIKENYNDLLNGKDEVFYKLKKIIRNDLYNNIINIYKENKNKILN